MCVKTAFLYIQLIVWILFPSQLFSQRSHPFEFVEAGFFFHSISLPFKASNKLIAFNRPPGFRISTSIPFQDRGSNFSYRPSLAFYHQRKLHRALHLENQVFYASQNRNQCFPEVGMGLGYLHSFEDAPVYRLEQQRYRQKRDLGRAQFTIALGLGGGFLLSKRSRTAIVLQQQLLLQWPFARKGGVSFILHNRTHIGIRRYFPGSLH